MNRRRMPSQHSSRSSTSAAQELSAIETARYNLNNCRVYAPFDARVTNLTISEGAYAHTGQQMFVLIDARTWWALANFREGQLHAYRARDARRCLCHVQTERSLLRRGGQHRIRRDSGRGRDRPFRTRFAGCTKDAELGPSRVPLSGSRARRESAARICFG